MAATAKFFPTDRLGCTQIIRMQPFGPALYKRSEFQYLPIRHIHTFRFSLYPIYVYLRSSVEKTSSFVFHVRSWLDKLRYRISITSPYE